MESTVPPAEGQQSAREGPVVRAFVSYAEEDQQAAARVAQWLRTRGVVPFVFQDEAKRGGRFVQEIETSLREANLFLVLLSAAYLRSDWCRRERDVALAREVALGRQFIFVLEIAPTSGLHLGFLESYNRLDATGRLDALAAALPLDGRSSPPTPPDRLDWRKPVVVAAFVLAVLVIGFALWPRTGSPTPAQATTSRAPTTSAQPAPSPTAAQTAGNVLTVVSDKPGCATSYLVRGAVHTAADRQATAVWLVDELYAGTSHNDPNNLYFAKVRLALSADGTFELRVPANVESGARDSRLLLVASPTAEADRDLAMSLSADQIKSSAYSDLRRTQLQLGNVEIATSPDFHQEC